MNGKSLLHYAAQRGSLESLNLFMKLFGVENIKFDLTDKWMNTPLSVAINCKHFNFVQKLIEMDLVPLKGYIYEEPKPRHQANLMGN